MSRNFKLGFAISVLIIGFLLVAFTDVTLVQFGSFLGVFSTFALFVEKWIEPKKEAQLKEEIKDEL